MISYKSLLVVLVVGGILSVSMLLLGILIASNSDVNIGSSVLVEAAHSTSNPLETKRSTSTPAPRKTPTVSRNFSYVEELDNYIQKYNDANESFDSLMIDLDGDPDLIYDQSWRDEVNETISLIVFYVRMQYELDPPAGFEYFHLLVGELMVEEEAWAKNVMLCLDGNSRNCDSWNFHTDNIAELYSKLNSELDRLELLEGDVSHGGSK